VADGTGVEGVWPMSVAYGWRREVVKLMRVKTPLTKADYIGEPGRIKQWLAKQRSGSIRDNAEPGSFAWVRRLWTYLDQRHQMPLRCEKAQWFVGRLGEDTCGLGSVSNKVPNSKAGNAFRGFLHRIRWWIYSRNPVTGL